VTDAPDKPETREVPQSFWEKVRARPWLYAGIAASFVVPLIIGTWLFIASGSGFSEYPDEEESREPTSVSQLTSESIEPTSVETTTQPDAEDGAGSDDTDSDELAYSPRIAYRQGGKIYVADADGASPSEVASSTRGAFALSPDAATLAWVDGGTAKLYVSATDGTGGPIEVGPAEDVTPSWAADSSHVLYTSADASGTAVRVVARDGTGDRELGRGHTPRASADAMQLAYIDASGQGHVGDVVITDLEGRGPVRLEGAGAVEAYPAGQYVIYSVPGPEPNSEEIRIHDTDSGANETLVGPAHLGLPVVYSGLTGSPGGEWLLYSASGDDGFSHAYVIEAEPGASPRSLKVRRDVYQLRWGVDDERLYLVEGNAFQGEPTKVISVSPEGLGRAVVIESGGM
jgi:hypothetical protein